jgi:ribosomal protein S18 acetylase RimI-like enzyme
MARRGDAAGHWHPDDRGVHTRRLRGLTVRPLRNGDTATVAALHARLGERSRTQRFGGAKPRLSDRELAALALVDGEHHVLVAYVDGDAAPAGIAQLVRAGEAAEFACAVADVYQRRGIGSLLARTLAADARAAGITTLRATVTGDNPGALALLRRQARVLEARWSGGELDVVAVLVPAPP